MHGVCLSPPRPCRPQAHDGLRRLNKLLRRLDVAAAERAGQSIDRRALRAQLAGYATRAAVVVGSPVACPLGGVRWPAIALLTSLAKRAAAGGPLGEAGVRELKLLSAWAKVRLTKRSAAPGSSPVSTGTTSGTLTSSTEKGSARIVAPCRSGRPVVVVHDRVSSPCRRRRRRHFTTWQRRPGRSDSSLGRIG